MFDGLRSFHSPLESEVELASQALADEGAHRFPSFSANDAVTLGLSLRKRFRQGSRHRAGKGMVIAVQTIQGHTLFSCTVGDLGDSAGMSDVSLDSWACVEGMCAVVRRTGHSSYYVEKGMHALGKTPKQLGIQGDFRVQGGAFPIWLENGLCCPIAIVACYSGSSADDHRIVVNAVRDYIKKMHSDPENMGSVAPEPPVNRMPMPSPSHLRVQEFHDDSMRDSMGWISDAAANVTT